MNRSKRMLNALTSDLITRSGEAIGQAGITTLAQVRAARHRLILLSDEMEALRREAKAISRHASVRERRGHARARARAPDHHFAL